LAIDEQLETEVLVIWIVQNGAKYSFSVGVGGISACVHARASVCEEIGFSLH
jgi:hypothetical protein